MWFRQGFQTLENSKNTRLAAPCSISFLVFGNPDETLALGFETVLHFPVLRAVAPEV